MRIRRKGTASVVTVLLFKLLLGNRSRVFKIAEVKGRLYTLKIEELCTLDSILNAARDKGILSKDELTKNANQSKN